MTAEIGERESRPERLVRALGPGRGAPLLQLFIRLATGVSYRVPRSGNCPTPTDGFRCPGGTVQMPRPASRPCSLSLRCPRQPPIYVCYHGSSGSRPSGREWGPEGLPSPRLPASSGFASRGHLAKSAKSFDATTGAGGGYWHREGGPGRLLSVLVTGQTGRPHSKESSASRG